MENLSPLVVKGHQDITNALNDQRNENGNQMIRNRRNKAGQIIDYRAMINQETRLNAEDLRSNGQQDNCVNF